MALSIQPSLYLSLFILSAISTTSLATTPKALVLPVYKDTATLQYTTHLSQRTPLLPIQLLIDVGGHFLWVNCDSHYSSSTYRPARCGSSQCSLAHATNCGTCFSSPRPGCFNNTCTLLPYNPVSHTASSGQLGSDIVSLPSTNGSNPGLNVTITNLLFVCAPTSLLHGLATGVSGIAGLGRAHISLPSLFSSSFHFPRKFAICLPSSSASPGVLFFGPGPYKFMPGVDLSESFRYTPLRTNPVSTTDYFINVKSIIVNSTSIGFGGLAKISTVEPYTVLKTSVYKSLLRVYAAEAAAMNITKVASVKPFGLCFSTKGVPVSRLGLVVPSVTLKLEGDVSWVLTGMNSVVLVSDEVLCLGFVDGGDSPKTSIVIGAYQLNNNLLQFDLERSRFGFTFNLAGIRTGCGNFNFTSAA